VWRAAMKKKYFVYFLSFFIFILSFTVQADSKVIRWGVYHPNPGEVPVGETTDEYLLQYDAYYHGFANGEKVLYLTFDAGYEDGNTERILDSLRDRGVNAAFFLTGNYIKSNPDMVKRIVSEGHLIGNHTMTHPDTYKLNSVDFYKEIKNVEDVYKEIIGSEMPKYYRPPECAFNENNLKVTKEKGYKTLLWSIAYNDWQKKQPSHKEAFARIIPNLHPGAIILLHTTSQTNAAIMSEIIDKCRDKGYIFKSLDNL